MIFIPLTETELEVVLDVVQKSYKIPDTHPIFDVLENQLSIHSFTANHLSKVLKVTAAEHTREMLWNGFSGGGVSAGVTMKAFKAIGRGKECYPNWI